MVNVFISYSHRDNELRAELETHLSLLKRQGIVRTWYDREIGAGEEIDPRIREELEKADIILLLVSPYFLASDYSIASTTKSITDVSFVTQCSLSRR